VRPLPPLLDELLLPKLRSDNNALLGDDPDGGGVLLPEHTEAAGDKASRQEPELLRDVSCAWQSTELEARSTNWPLVNASVIGWVRHYMKIDYKFLS